MKVFVRKANREFDIDFDKLPENVQSFIIEYGLKQKLSDGLSQYKDIGEADAAKLVEESIEALKSGNIRRGGGGAKLSPMDKATRDVLESVLKSMGREAKDAKAEAKDFEAAFKAIAEAKDSTVAKVRKAVEAKAAPLAEAYAAKDDTSLDL